MGSIFLSLSAGVLTVLSPCVFPVLPFVVGSGAQRHRFAPVAVVTGLVVSFVVLGMVVSAAGAALGFNTNTIRTVSAVLMLGAGGILVTPPVQRFFMQRAAPLASFAGNLQGKADGGLAGSFFTGSLLGAVWSPCIGPTLGAALGLAAQGDSLLAATGIMTAFGIGAAIPLLFVAYGSRSLFLKWRDRLVSSGNTGKKIFGILFLVLGVIVLGNFDKTLEAFLLTHLPDWWVALITRF
jgi:cytochrome c biogenesis protein CcdA